MAKKYSENQEVGLALTYDEWKKRPQYQPKWPVHILCDRMQFQENAGQVIRSAANLGALRIYFFQSQFQWVPSKIDKLSRSNATNVEIVHAHQFSDIPFEKYSEVIALEYTHHSQCIYDVILKGPTLLIAGSESAGIQADMIKRADRSMHIPLVGKQSSINVAHALTGALTYINHYRLSVGR